jgi:cytochrome c553
MVCVLNNFVKELNEENSMKYRYLLLVVAMGALGAGCTSIENSRNLANPNVPAKVIAQQVCSLCHGINGQSVSPNFPNLAAQQSTYFIAQMKEFRGHNRLDPAGFEYMWGLSRSLTDEQIQGLAEYFVAKAPAAPPGRFSDPAVVAGGKVIFEQGVPEKNIPSCGVCHGTQAQGNAQFPRLAHQHSDYLIKQLMVFQRTDERPEGSIMKTIAHDLTRKNMEDVAAYLQDFPQQ